jgi:hypothetical protein
MRSDSRGSGADEADHVEDNERRRAPAVRLSGGV